MSARVVALVAQDKARWSLAGDQLFVDFDLSEQNLPPGTRIAIGATVVEVTDQPHRRLPQVRRAFRAGCDELRQLAARVRAAPARDQRPRRPTRADSGWRHGAQASLTAHFFFAAKTFRLLADDVDQISHRQVDVDQVQSPVGPVAAPPVRCHRRCRRPGGSAGSPCTVISRKIAFSFLVHFAVNIGRAR